MINSKELDFNHELGNIQEQVMADYSDDDELPDFLDNKDPNKTAGD